MAATPMLIVRKPTNLLQTIQTVEYNFGLLLKRIFGAIGGIHVTPGPFSLFRSEVFEKIGNYRKAHNTEDMELTFRMQKNHMKIVSSLDSYVETSTPNTVYKLYKQRLRWTQGFMQNSIDYKDMLLRPRYGSVALLTIPLGWIGITMVLYMALYWLYSFVKFIISKFATYQAIGWDIFNFNTFTYANLNMNFIVEYFSNLFNNIFLQISPVSLIAIPILVSGLVFIIMGHNMSLMNSRRLRYIFYFIFLWEFLIPFWFGKALYNTITNRKNQWR
jgi:cellulose synthase/poly-beta-1,6-N-acetylglucosamine synthase-like glycosyltransferase